MDPTYIFGLAQALNTIISSDTTKYAIDGMTGFKDSKDKNAVIAKYEEIFSSLISENQELKKVALGYKDEYEKMNITDDNIEYLRNTFNRVLTLLTNMGGGDDEQQRYIEQFSNLIEVDTLKTMQLLGFNYKKAIGEPLTEIVNHYISSLYNNSILNNDTTEEVE